MCPQRRNALPRKVVAGNHGSLMRRSERLGRQGPLNEVGQQTVHPLPHHRV
jgi:hypothetical protein